MRNLEPYLKDIEKLGDKCSFCPAPMLDSCFIEAGNNAEVTIVVNCCDAHVREMDADALAFEKKYAAIIDKMVAEKGAGL